MKCEFNEIQTATKEALISLKTLNFIVLTAFLILITMLNVDVIKNSKLLINYYIQQCIFMKMEENFFMIIKKFKIKAGDKMTGLLIKTCWNVRLMPGESLDARNGRLVMP